MAEKKLDGGVPVGGKQFTTTGGNVITPVEGFQNNSGVGIPPCPGAYGAPAEGPEFPSAEKMPSGNAKAIGAFFGTKNPGGSGGK